MKLLAIKCRCSVVVKSGVVKVPPNVDVQL